MNRKIDKKNSPTDWFEELYANADISGTGVPWAKMEPNPHLLKWLDTFKPKAEGRSALVVGAGMGDDAVALAEYGYDVSAFDVSPTAMEFASNRFQGMNVRFQTAGLLDPPEGWSRAYDFVFESITVQALPPEYQAQAMQNIADFVAPTGNLLMMTWIRPLHIEPQGPPWPLAIEHLDEYKKANLEVINVTERPHDASKHLQILYRRNGD